MLESPQSEAAVTEWERQLCRRAEQAEGRVAEMLATMPHAYIAINRDWTITVANREACIANRLPMEAFAGKNFWVLWPSLVGTEVERQFRLAMDTGVPVQFGHYSPAYDAWFEMNVHPSEDGIAVYYTDVTQRRRAEEALKESEHRYRVFTELNPQLILMADTRGQVTYANQRLLAYSGMTLEETVGEGWRTAVHPDDEMRVLGSWMEALGRDIDFEVETRIRRGSDGAYRWFLIRGLPVRDEQDRTLYWLGVCIDIDEWKMAVEDLENSRRETEHQRLELESLYRTAPIGLALFDPVEFRYLRLNDRQAEIVGLPIEKVLGRTLTEIAPIEGLREMFEQVARGEPVVNSLLEGELPTQPGVHRYWTVNYYPVYGADGRIRAITAASLEITAQKRAEMALIQSEKLAAVGRLASSISHEINNPLEAVTNLLYLALNQEPIPVAVRGYLETAQEELARVSQISTQALRFHRQTTRPVRVSSAALMNSVVDLYLGRLANSGIEVEMRYAAAAPVLCFENDIRQVLTNLIANAFDAMRSGGRLLLRTHDCVDWKTGRRGVRFTVADSGHGIPAQAKKRLFEAFYTTKGMNGTGLGLWISRGIAERHEGWLSVRSSDREGRSGTVFALFLPECEAAEDAE